MIVDFYNFRSELIVVYIRYVIEIFYVCLGFIIFIYMYKWGLNSISIGKNEGWIVLVLESNLFSCKKCFYGFWFYIFFFF